MEDALVPLGTNPNSLRNEVLILVLMEDALVQKEQFKQYAIGNEMS